MNTIYPSFGNSINFYKENENEQKSNLLCLFNSCRQSADSAIPEVDFSNATAPSLNSYSKADLRISNHATESFEWKKQLVASAQKSIEISFNFAGGESLHEILILIEERMIQNSELKTYLLLSEDLLEAGDREILHNLQAIHPHHFHFLITDRVYKINPRPHSEENHVKLMIIDEQYFVIGGTGVHNRMGREISLESNRNESRISKLIDNGFRDSDLIGYGEIAKTMRREFFNLYRIWEFRMLGKNEDHFYPLSGEKGRCSYFHTSENLFINSDIKFIVGGPEHRKKNPIFQEIKQLASKATEEIRIANLIFNPDEKLRAILLDRKKEGVNIIGYLNGIGNNSSWLHYLFVLPDRTNYDLLTEANEYQPESQLYHKKVWVFDKKITVIGTANLGIKSREGDYEAVCVIDNPLIAQEMNKALDEDAARSRKYTVEDVDSCLQNKIGKILNCIIGPYFI